MVLLTQHYDTVSSVGARSKATIMMIPYTPDGMSQVGDQITQALLTTSESALPAESHDGHGGKGTPKVPHHEHAEVPIHWSRIARDSRPQLHAMAKAPGCSPGAFSLQ